MTPSRKADLVTASYNLIKTGRLRTNLNIGGFEGTLAINDKPGEDVALGHNFDATLTGEHDDKIIQTSLSFIFGADSIPSRLELIEMFEASQRSSQGDEPDADDGKW